MPYDDAVGVEGFLAWASLALGPHGFTRDTSLPLVSVCRDELMFAFSDAVAAHWGHAFDVSSLAGLPLLGRTGIAAALGHTPDEDGRHRLVGFAFPHIGLDSGRIGAVHRPGVPGVTTACGAVEAARAALAEGVSGVVLDPHDLEESMLVARLRRVVGSSVPDLVQTTELVRRAAVDELELLLTGLSSPEVPVDVALLSGVVVHRASDDVVSVASATVWVDDIRHDITSLPQP